MDNTARICDALEQLLARYEQWEEPLRRYFDENFSRVNTNGYTWQQFHQGRRQLHAAMTTEYDPYPEIFRSVTELCMQYTASDSDGRANMRAWSAKWDGLCGLIRGYASHIVKKILHPQHAPLLTLALAAVSIENCVSDHRDTLTTLADLYAGAEEAGIDPKPWFERASELSADAPTSGGCNSLARTLREFQTNAVLDERRRRER